MRLSIPQTFVAIVLILITGAFPLFDVDFFWHVKTGEEIYKSHRLPVSDIFSYNTGQSEWVIQGWLFKVILYLVWDSFGLAGLRLLVASLCLFTWYFSYQTARLYCARTGIALLISGLVIPALIPVMAPRYTLFTALGVSWTLYALLSAGTLGGKKRLAMLPLLFAVWSNMNFGFPIGLFLIGLFIASAYLDRKASPAKLRLGRELISPMFLIAIFAGCLLATGLNPYGYGLIAEIFQTFQTVAGAPITEWQSPRFETVTGKLYLAILLIFVGTTLVFRQKKQSIDLLVPLVFIAVGFSAIRHIGVYGIVMSAFLARNLRTNGCGAAPSQARSQSGTPAPRQELSKASESLLNASLIVLVAGLTWLGSGDVERRFENFKRAVLPIGAADFIETHALSGRLFNTFNGGGYLIYRLYPKFLVFIDNRYHVYPRHIYQDFRAIFNGDPNWFGTLQRYEPEILVCETWSPLRQLLLSRPEFRLVYEDRYFSVLIRDLGRFKSIQTIEPNLELPSIMR